MSNRHQLGYDDVPERYAGDKETINKMAEVPGGAYGLFHTAVRQIIRYQDRAGRKDGDTEEDDAGKAKWYAQLARHLLLRERYPDPRSGRTKPFEEMPFESLLSERHLLALHVIEEATERGPDGFGIQPSDIAPPMGLGYASVKPVLQELRVLGLIEYGLGPKDLPSRGVPNVRRSTRVRVTWLCDLIANDVRSAAEPE